MDKFRNFINDLWAIGFVRFIVYLGLAFLAAGLACWLVTKVLKLLKLDRKFDKWGINEGAADTSLKFVGKFVYLLVFLLFLPSALEAVGIHEVTGPITNFVNTFVSYLPNIIIAFILVYVGILIAQILGQLVSVLLKKTKIDNLVQRTDANQKSTVLLSDLLVKILMTVIIIIAVISALSVLNIQAISAPAINIVNTIFNAIPNIVLAVVIVAVGALVTNLACSLLYNVLLAVNFDGTVKKVLPQLKISATKVVVNLVRTFIIIFVAAQGIQALNLSILTMIVVEIVAYLPMVIKAAVVLLVAFIGANILEDIILKANPKAGNLAKVVKVGIFTVAGFMILSQLNIATYIVNTAFIVALAAVAVSFALAFGLGGKDFAKKTLERVDEKLDSCNKDAE